MKELCDIFTINGAPILVPDADMSVSFSDLESTDSGKDESGTHHRIVIQYNKGKWVFSYGSITEEEKNYMERLFPDAPDFEFGYPDRKDSTVRRTCRAYRAGYSIAWKDAKTGLWKNYKFTISEC